jgi:hypothetical protein
MDVHLNEVLAGIRFASRLGSAGPGRSCSSPRMMMLVVTVQSLQASEVWLLRASEVWLLRALPPDSGRCAFMTGAGS